MDWTEKSGWASETRKTTDLGKIEQYFAGSFFPYELSENGIWITDEKKKEKRQISVIPVIPTAILRNVDTGVEKIELTLLRRGRVEKIIEQRSVVASANSIIRLVDKGLEVSTDNARQLCKYISDMVRFNYNTIAEKQSKSVMGWIDKDFMPYSGSMTFDGEDQFRSVFRALKSRGSLEEWSAFLAPYRRKKELRLAMSASFASPLIELIGENPFILHLWGGTGTGKTVCLMVAMSVWGDPALGKLVKTMNMTANSMMETAAFLCNLPFAGDELQTIKETWKNYDQLIMRVTEGINRGRMKFDTISETKSWKCAFLFSGEEPCTREDSGGGAKNRVIEIDLHDSAVGEGNGNTVVNFIKSHYGQAGPVFTRAVAERESLSAEYQELFSELMQYGTTDKQAGSMALCLLADRIASALFWPEEEPLTCQDVAQYLKSADEVDIAERAYKWLLNTISANSNSFSATAKVIWGELEPYCCYFNRSILASVLHEAGYEFDAVKKRWAERGYIRCQAGSYRTMKRINGTATSTICINLPTAEEEEDPLPF